jgi:hypothetical protein
MSEPSVLSRPDREAAVIGAEERARHATERAARARRHASGAREQAVLDAGNGNAAHELMHRQEAEFHEAAARRQEKAAAVQRHHAAWMRRQSVSDWMPRGPADRGCLAQRVAAVAANPHRKCSEPTLAVQASGETIAPTPGEQPLR